VKVSDADVRRALTWARNYGEIESFEAIRPDGRKWVVRTNVQTTVNGDVRATPPRHTTLDHHVVPSELVFTSREAIAFAYGLSIAGAYHGGRQAHARREWGW
jgi:hypothetical protein